MYLPLCQFIFQKPQKIQSCKAERFQSLPPVSNCHNYFLFKCQITGKWFISRKIGLQKPTALLPEGFLAICQPTVFRRGELTNNIACRVVWCSLSFQQYVCLYFLTPVDFPMLNYCSYCQITHFIPLLAVLQKYMESRQLVNATWF